MIVPCFNCERKVRQAIESIFRQDLQIPFEIIMVDDGSTDSTAFMLSDLKKKYSHIHVLSHKKNMGGGKSRNDAIKKSKGTLLFCLDSDDILPPKMLPKLISYLQEKKCDGVIFEQAKYFMWTTLITQTAKNDVDPNKAITIRDLFTHEDSPLTQVNFLYTRTAFDRIGGYPEHHGFD